MSCFLNPDVSFDVVGLERVGGEAFVHVRAGTYRVWRVFGVHRKIIMDLHGSTSPSA